MPLPSKPCERPEGPRGQWTAADQVRLRKYNIDGEHINSPPDSTHVENLQQALEDIDKEAQEVKRLASGLRDVVLVRRGVKSGGEVESPVVNKDGRIEIGIWFNEIEAADAVGGDTYLPVGAVIPWTSASEVPHGWLECDGRLLDRFIYIDLFRTLCFHYGKDNTGNRFRLPDLRGVGLLGTPPARSPVDGSSGMYLVRDRNRYPAAALDGNLQPSGPANPGGLAGPFDPRARPNTIPSTPSEYLGNYEPGTLFPPAAVSASAEPPDAEIPATAFCRWIIKWLDDNKAGIRSATWIQSSGGWRADLVDGNLRLFHPPGVVDNSGENQPSEWTAEPLNISWGSWENNPDNNITITWAADMAGANSTVIVNIRENTGSQVFRIGLVSGSRYLDGRFDVPKGWQFQMNASSVPTAGNAAAVRIRKT